MKRNAFVTVAACASLAGSASARALTTQEQIAALLARSFPANPSNSYTPSTISCPPNVPSIRTASGLSDNETAWLPLRRNATLAPMRDLLGRANISGFDASGYINQYTSNASALPNIGIAISGGGYRAMLNGAGVLEAFDDRTTNSTAAGQLGGLLQSATYLSGLSGGSWLVGSLYTNNFSSIDAILAQDTDASDSGDLWQFGNSIFEGPATSKIQVLSSADYYAHLLSQVNGKSDAGYNTSITDYWGRALSYQLVNATDGGPAYTFSSIAQQDWFTSGSVPLPLLVTDSRAPHTKIVSSNSTIFDINPWEFGSDDPTLYGFAPLQYLGTNYTGGSRVGDECVIGYDNVGFVMGTSSTLFNEALTQINGTNTTGLFSTALQDAIEAILKNLGQDDDDISAWPNPFYGFNNATNVDAHVRELTLVDGGEDGQNIPLHPLIQPDRNVDVIFAVDTSADTTADSPAPSGGNAANWPLGISLVSTYERSQDPIGNGTAFPSIPDTNTFVNLGLNLRPTFFGCDASNLTGPAPLIVYLPNAPYVYTSNTSTFDLQYNDTQRDAMVLNGYNLATQSNSTLDPKWPTCVGCAILSRSFDRTNTELPSDCTQCFERYCWNGTVDSSTPAPYVPAYRSPQAAVKMTSAAVPQMAASMGLAIVVAAITGLTIM